jgi:hypothetical protein
VSLLLKKNGFQSNHIKESEYDHTIENKNENENKNDDKNDLKNKSKKEGKKYHVQSHEKAKNEEKEKEEKEEKKEGKEKKEKKDEKEKKGRKDLRDDPPPGTAYSMKRNPPTRGNPPVGCEISPTGGNPPVECEISPTGGNPPVGCEIPLTVSSHTNRPEIQTAIERGKYSVNAIQTPVPLVEGAGCIMTCSDKIGKWNALGTSIIICFSHFLIVFLIFLLFFLLFPSFFFFFFFSPLPLL